MEGGPPAKRRRLCRSDFLEDEEWSTQEQNTLVRDHSTPVRQQDGSSSRSKFDSNEESDDDSNGKCKTPHFCFPTDWNTLERIIYVISFISCETCEAVDQVGGFYFYSPNEPANSRKARLLHCDAMIWLHKTRPALLASCTHMAYGWTTWSVGHTVQCDETNVADICQLQDLLLLMQLVLQATPFAERGKVWSRCNHQVIAMAETWCDQSDPHSS